MGPPSPLSYTLSSFIQTYTPGSTSPINVTLSGPQEYIGLLLYAATDIYAPTHLGKWTNLDETKFQFMNAECQPYGENATLTHTDPFAKRVSVMFQWVPPASPADGNVHFYAVVVAEPREMVGFQVITSNPIRAGDGSETSTAGPGTQATSTVEGRAGASGPDTTTTAEGETVTSTAGASGLEAMTIGEKAETTMIAEGGLGGARIRKRAMRRKRR